MFSYIESFEKRNRANNAAKIDANKRFTSDSSAANTSPMPHPRSSRKRNPPRSEIDLYSVSDSATATSLVYHDHKIKKKLFSE